MAAFEWTRFVQQWIMQFSWEKTTVFKSKNDRKLLYDDEYVSMSIFSLDYFQSVNSLLFSNCIEYLRATYSSNQNKNIFNDWSYTGNEDSIKLPIYTACCSNNKMPGNHNPCLLNLTECVHIAISMHHRMGVAYISVDVDFVGEHMDTHWAKDCAL